jgi:signal transduction histidine kinase/streptogramin lyase
MITNPYKTYQLCLLFVLCFMQNIHWGQSNYTLKKQSALSDIPALASVKNVQSALKDSRGFIWLGAEGGIYKFNGYEVTRYPIDASRPHDLTQNQVRAIAEDKEGNVWFGIWGTGLKKFDPKKEAFTTYEINVKDPNQKYYPSSEIIDIVVHNDVLRISTTTGNCQFLLKTNSFKKDIDYSTLIVGENNALWAFSSDVLNVYKISLYDGKTDTFKPKLVVKDVQNFEPLLAYKNKIYLRVNNSLRVYDIAQNTIFNYDVIEKSRPLSIKPINEQKLLILRYDNVEVLDLSTASTSVILNEKDFKEKGIYNSLIVPISKQLYLLTGVKNQLFNLNKPNIEVFSLFEDDKKLDFNNNLLFQWPTGLLGIGELITVDLAKAQVINSNYLFPAIQKFANLNNNLANINQYIDAEGTHWLALFGEKYAYTYTTLYSFKPKLGGVLTSLGSFDFTGIDGLTNTCMVKEGNNLWIGSKAGLVKFNIQNKQHERIRIQKETTDINVNSMFVDSAGDLWICTQTGLKLKKNGSNIVVNVNLSQSNNNTHSNWMSKVKEDKNGLIWIATGGGICSLEKKTGKYKWYTTQQGLADNFLFNLEIDDEQTIWVSHDKGISHLNPMTGKVQNYANSDGIKEDLIESSLKLKDGSLVFASKNMLYHINPKLIIPDSTPVPIYISDIQLFNKSIEIKDKNSPLNQHISFSKAITFSHKENVITLHFSAIDFTDVEHRKYAYMLDGFDKDWQYVEQKREVTYTNLPSGTYRFRIKSENRYDIWTEMPNPLAIQILPPWWQRWWAWLVYLGVVFMGVRAYNHYRSRALRQYNKELEEKVKVRTSEVVAQKEALNKTLIDLKETQTQLIQREKMASLGELTAGIAHEIQNPLNFVNNFSELSVELAEELTDELKKPDLDKDLIGELMLDLNRNQQKINHHGKRASNIVKNMLEHSRTSSGEKEPTDLNALIREYLPLSYHGMRSKDKTFNSEFIMDCDECLEKATVVSQDIGRVFLNLFNNAFYAVHQRKLLDDNHTPSVLVTSQKVDNQLIIKVKDNGGGIPEHNIKKIFQPFFTTKPTGEGTGLGLSLSYDIVTKGHGGSLEVVSKEGFGSEFILKLPKEK